MKVAIVTQFPSDPDAPHGGVETVSVNLVRALAEFDDLELHVVTADPACREAQRSVFGKISIHRLPQLGRTTLGGAIGQGRRQISEYVQELAPDVVHAHDTYGIMVKGLRIPRVFTVHGFIYGDTLVSGQRWPGLRSRIWRAVETSAWADQPHIISISPYVRERLAGIATGVIHDIDNPVGERFFDIPRQERRGVIFSAAVISPRKNTLVLVEAFARLIGAGVDAELHLAGKITHPEYGAAVQEKIRALGLVDRVSLLGSIGVAQVCEQLAQSSVFALTSLEENSPMGIEEAMAAGVPVVTSNRCGMPYMVRHGESGFLVDPNEAEDVARRLAQLLQDDSLRSAMGAYSRRIALDRFHPAAVARRTREVYLDAVGRRRKASV